MKTNIKKYIGLAGLVSALTFTGPSLGSAATFGRYNISTQGEGETISYTLRRDDNLGCHIQGNETTPFQYTQTNENEYMLTPLPGIPNNAQGLENECNIILENYIAKEKDKSKTNNGFAIASAIGALTSSIAIALNRNKY